MKEKNTKHGAKGLFVSFAAAALSLLLLSGCGLIAFNRPQKDGDGDTSAESGYQVAEYEKYESNYTEKSNGFIKKLGKKNFEGASFLIAASKPSAVVSDENSGAVMSKELDRRNSALKTNYNINISAKQTDPTLMRDEIRAAVKAGSYYADLIMIPQTQIGTYSAQGLLTNLNSLPGLDLSAEYFDEKGIEAATGGNKTYAAAGAATLDTDCLPAVFFNKELVARCGLDMPYSYVREGSWTWDKFFQYTSALAALDGGAYHSYGAQNTSLSLTDIIYFSCGGTFVNSPSTALPSLAITADVSASFLEVASRVRYDPAADTDSLNAINNFQNGGTMFLIDRAGTMKALADSPVDWGILPMPKYILEQSGYISLSAGDEALMFGVVPTVTDTDRVSFMLSAINAYAYGYTKDAAVENAMSYYLRDNDSAKMLDIIADSATYDFAYSFSVLNEAISAPTFTAVRNTVSGISSVQGYLNAWTNRFNAAVYRIFSD